MTFLSDPFIYLFYPNPGNASWSSPKAFVLLLVCFTLVVVSFGIRAWRRQQQGASIRKLSRSWAAASLWFGLTGLFLVVARVESISYISMRLWWVVWGIIALFYLFIQVRLFRMRYYEVLPRHENADDPRAKYLPRRKKR